MKNITAFIMASIIFCSLFSLEKIAIAAGDSCYQISNQDSKHFCLGTAKRDKNYCYQINESNRKNMCLAPAGNDKNYCYQINNTEIKNQCLGQF
jgi:hypothetical protein